MGIIKHSILSDHFFENNLGSLYISYQSLCPPWFPPLPRQQDCILEYILPTKPKRAIIIPLLSEKEGFI
ncbi:MAG: hypothetical protein EWV53_22345 [Microcystis panniformis Mp_MB_F_20051200_S9]|uniref:Uncharacterized protein n=1 Tax=Microcystis panniformis Mp_MB_F_20051200_S9 TaxID=2486223 RepID=A0A552PI63_9CHRO|nr:MAG: hypothetical protein EWV43_10750 [Microcystis panniformis Mp_MB_F_20080800_S26D]TRV49165.1 MAG: hypothetical protein EWV42_13520 [Microcystis panniformis Mp_GB_SS_20050300_S99D]TRV53394.1 MAG: hypothetical protein EWV87_03130 [Microcystis panniformis Mp_GB_SS_20050300_S99]TRV55263.1 MAG: hypothetical protein EWV69_20590 [Microcystis panniformis Mp_MB_F_20080800_S26]TRV56650.1 MAG: hypothetical protein EWV53_22345 [Microcystis panniformis Mp_MB_F_20051200_S9]TRV63678.1 MAG: hypothetical